MNKNFAYLTLFLFLLTSCKKEEKKEIRFNIDLTNFSLINNDDFYMLYQYCEQPNFDEQKIDVQLISLENQEIISQYYGTNSVEHKYAHHFIEDSYGRNEYYYKYLNSRNIAIEQHLPVSGDKVQSSTFIDESIDYSDAKYNSTKFVEGVFAFYTNLLYLNELMSSIENEDRSSLINCYSNETSFYIRIETTLTDDYYYNIYEIELDASFRILRALFFKQSFGYLSINNSYSEVTDFSLPSGYTSWFEEETISDQTSVDLSTIEETL